MAQNEIYNPSLPFIGKINQVVNPGFGITIRGNTHPNCSRFAINIQSGPNVYPRDDVLLHIGVDFIRNCVVRNSIHNNNWGPEENQQDYFPLAKNAPFVIEIVCEAGYFNIAINGKHFTSFIHRVVYHRANHLAIDGDIYIEKIEFRSTRSSPYPEGSYQQCPAPMPGINPNIYPSYPSCPSYPPAAGMPMAAPYPQYLQSPYGQGPVSGHQPNLYGYQNSPVPPQSPHFPGNKSGTHTGHKQGLMGGVLNKIGAGGVAATAATAGLGMLGGKKAWKGQKKARKKALKYGLPIAGVGVGAYALSKMWSSSSSSSSSDEE